MAADAAAADSAEAVTYEELIQLEYEFDNVDAQIIRQQYALSQSLYARRSALTSRIPGFWALVFEQAPADIDHFIKPFDMQIFADALLSFSVDRFEINAQPRSFSLRFEFDADKNAYFSDVVLEKKFYLRRSRDGWSGLVSEPVPIHWHDGKDPTDGMMDAAVAFWRKQAEHGQWDAAKLKGTPEFADVVKKAEDPAAVLSTFFTLFAFVANKRYVTAEESAEAEASEAERRSRRAKGEKVEDPEDEPLSLEATDVMVCPHGDDLATALAEDLWPNAIKYFTHAQENDDEPLSEADFESGDAMDESESEEEVNIRALVKGRTPNKRKGKASGGSDGDADAPPKSKMKMTS